jgi:hypothetical protein
VRLRDGESFSCSRKCPLCRAGIALPLIYTKFGIKSDNEPIVGRAPTNVSAPPTSAPLGVYPVALEPPRRAPPVQVTPRTSPSVHVTPIISTPVPAPSLASAAAATDQRQAPSLRGIYFTVAVPANRARTTPTSQAATEVTPSDRAPNAAEPNSHAANGHTNRTSSATYACGPSPQIVTGHQCSETKNIDYEADTTRGHYYRYRPALAARLVAAATTAANEAARCAGKRRPLQPPPVVRPPTLPTWLLTEVSSGHRTTAGPPRSAEKAQEQVLGTTDAPAGSLPPTTYSRFQSYDDYEAQRNMHAVALRQLQSLPLVRPLPPPCWQCNGNTVTYRTAENTI